VKRRIEGPALKLDQSFSYEHLALSSLVDLPSLQSIDENPLLSLGIQKGDIIIAGRNFGGLGHEFPEALKAADIACVIAASFSRSFYRNCINLGMPMIENSEAFNIISDGEIVSIDLDKGEISCKKGTLSFSPLPEVISRILASGGLIPHVKRSLGK
jgi:3-isopropylmalate/(R)-2-methylmalate dehydratase small subunit